VDLDESAARPVAAAAVAARLLAAALGTDTAAGPLPGFVLRDRGPQSDAWAREHPRRAVVGDARSRRPLARSVEDCALVMTAPPVLIRRLASILNGTPDYHGDRHRSARLRIGIPRSLSSRFEIDAAARAAIEVLVGLTSGPTRDVSIRAPDTYALLDAETYAYHAAARRCREARCTSR
jgi:Asp-tRNA(Asn)/Glu-tRNA(Gln) amidotransferase A subunit family amidase